MAEIEIDLKKVVVIGGGVAGLTAAHELQERGFAVVVYERNPRLGGKARSLNVPDNHTNVDIQGLPAEHGFRFFPGFYHHLGDTLSRIPYSAPNHPEVHHIVDNLRVVEKDAYARQGRTFFYIPAHHPRNWRAWIRAVTDMLSNPALGVPRHEAAFAAYKLADAMTMCRERREEKLDGRSWWDYMHAARWSPQYRSVIVQGLTQNFVAMDAKMSSTKSVINILARLLNDLMHPGGTIDRVLNGPTTDVWINHWEEYLTKHVWPDWGNNKGYVVGDRVSDPDGTIWQCCVGHTSETTGSFEDASQDPSLWMKIGPSVVVHKSTEGGEEGSVHSLGFDETKSRINGIKLSENGELKEKDAAHFIAAVPLEAMIKILENSPPEIITHAPKLTDLFSHVLQTNWMSGIMYYLKEDETMDAGHVIYLDSAWALTSISQNQFWEKAVATYGKPVSGILSVIVSDWFTKSPTTGKTAQQSSAAEVSGETLEQIKAHVSGDVLANLHDDNIAGSYPDPALEFAVEGHLIGRMPAREFARRKKNYKKTLMQGGAPGLARALRVERNVEPLFINTVNSWQRRPNARTEINNLFLASDYVKNDTDLATMEGANEAARLAVNGLLEHVGQGGPSDGVELTPCSLFEFDEPAVFAPLRRLDRWMYDHGLPHSPLAIEGRTRRIRKRVGEGMLNRESLKAIAEILRGSDAGGA